MGNLIWTSILYFSTSAIVFITYRTFVNDRKADNLRRASDVAALRMAQAKSREEASRRSPRRRPTAADVASPVAR